MGSLILSVDESEPLKIPSGPWLRSFPNLLKPSAFNFYNHSLTLHSHPPAASGSPTAYSIGTHTLSQLDSSLKSLSLASERGGYSYPSLLLDSTLDTCHI